MLGICGEQRCNGTACPVVGITSYEIVTSHGLRHNLNYYGFCGLKQDNKILVLHIGGISPSLGRDVTFKRTLFHIASVQFHYGALQIVHRNGSVLCNRQGKGSVTCLDCIYSIGYLLHIGSSEVTYLHLVTLHLVQVNKVCNGGKLHRYFLNFLLGILLGLNPVRVVSVAGTESCNESQ